MEALWGAKGRPNDPKLGRPGSTGRGRGGVKTPPQREEGFWEEGFSGRDAPKPPVAQRAGGITPTMLWHKGVLANALKN